MRLAKMQSLKSRMIFLARIKKIPVCKPISRQSFYLLDICTRASLSLSLSLLAGIRRGKKKLQRLYNRNVFGLSKYNEISSNLTFS